MFVHVLDCFQFIILLVVTFIFLNTKKIKMDEVDRLH